MTAEGAEIHKPEYVFRLPRLTVSRTVGFILLMPAVLVGAGIESGRFSTLLLLTVASFLLLSIPFVRVLFRGGVVLRVDESGVRSSIPLRGFGPIPWGDITVARIVRGKGRLDGRASDPPYIGIWVKNPDDALARSTLYYRLSVGIDRSLRFPTPFRIYEVGAHTLASILEAIHEAGKPHLVGPDEPSQEAAGRTRQEIALGETAPHAPRDRYQIRRHSTVAVYITLALNVLAIGGYAIGRLPFLLLLICGTLLLISVCLGRFWLDPNHYAVELLNEGLRGGGRRDVLPWSRISGLRERPLLHRVEVLSSDTNGRVRLDYQLDGFSEVLQRVLFHYRRSVVPTEMQFNRRFVRPMTLFEILVVLGFVALGVWASKKSISIGAIFVLGFPAAFVYEKLAEVSSVLVRGSSILLRRGFRSSQIELTSASVIEIGLRSDSGTQYLDVFVEDAQGNVVPLRPPGCDPFILFQTLKQAQASA